LDQHDDVTALSCPLISISSLPQVVVSGNH
jgi:hypothetical protein